MKITNYQKQQLKMYQIKSDIYISFEEAEKIIKKKKRELERWRSAWLKDNDLEGSGMFDRWTEDSPKRGKKK